MAQNATYSQVRQVPDEAYIGKHQCY